MANLPVIDLDIVGGGTGGASYFGAFTNYNDLVTSHPTANFGDFAVVENDQGTKWLPWTVGGTYYPEGTYYWNNTEWTSNVADIAEEIQNLKDTANTQDLGSVLTEGNISNTDILMRLNAVLFGSSDADSINSGVGGMVINSTQDIIIRGNSLAQTLKVLGSTTEVLGTNLNKFVVTPDLSQIEYGNGTFISKIQWPVLSQNANHFLQDKSGRLAHLDDIKPQTLSFSFTRNNNPNIQNNGSAYETSAKILYPGTGVTGIHTKMFSNAWNDGGTSIDLRVIDLTNGNNVIAQNLIIISQQEDNIVDLGTLSNLPTDEAVFAIQLRLNGGGMGDQAKISSLTIY